MKKIAIVVIKGGLGNQLFQLVFCNYLKSKNFKVILDTSAYGLSAKKLKTLNMTKRSLVFPIEIFGFKNANNVYVRFLKIVKKVYSIFLFNPDVKTHFRGHEFKYEETGLLNIFDGYWKNTNYLDENIDFLVNSLNSVEELKNFINKTPAPGSTLLHIRRGDFVDNGWDLPEQFFLNAIEYIQENKGISFFDIFTDDYQWVVDSSLSKHKKINKIISPTSDSRKEIIETFSKMFNYENYIIGNSTFSYFPAYLKNNKESIVIISNPWFPESYHPDISKSNWIKLKY